MSSLWHTIIALYGKCFVSTGQAAKLETNNCFSGQYQTFLKTHDELMNLRHNFVAHRGPTIHEYALAYIKVDPEKNESEIKIEQLKRNRPEQRDLDNYVILFDHLITLTEEKIKKAGNKL